MSKKLSIAQRAIFSTGWNVVANTVQVVVGFLRSIVLARLVEVKTFGIYGFAGAIVSLTATVAGFGFAEAFLHRSAETQDEERAASVYLTLSLVLGSIWALLLGGSAIAFSEGDLRTALLIMTVTQYGAFVNQVPRALLVRRVVHRRLAVLQLIDVLLSSGMAVILAWRGVELWALLVGNLITLMLSVTLLYIWRPVWRPRLIWSPEIVRYFLSFGAGSLLAGLLSQALDRLDDIWTGSYLGDLAMGYYSKAYTFATYPRIVLAASISKVASGTYAELAGSRKRLSQAFFRTNAFLVRSGFLLAGLLAVLAPEFIHLVIGDKWLPMLDTFRLMLVFTLLDPIRATVGHLYIAVGRPSQLVKAHLWQLAVLVAGLIIFGRILGISGVALAVDLMMVTGMVILLRQAKEHVEFSPRRLFLAPAVALLLSLLVSIVAVRFIAVETPSVLTALVKGILVSGSYGIILLCMERKQLREVVSFGIRKIVRQ